MLLWVCCIVCFMLNFLVKLLRLIGVILSVFLCRVSCCLLCVILILLVLWKWLLVMILDRLCVGCCLVLLCVCWLRLLLIMWCVIWSCGWLLFCCGFVCRNVFDVFIMFEFVLLYGVGSVLVVVMYWCVFVFVFLIVFVNLM